MILGVRYFHKSTPVAAFTAYKLLSKDPKYTVPLATTGLELIPKEPRSYIHFGTSFPTVVGLAIRT